MSDGIHDPGARVRALCEYGTRLTEIDMNIPVTRYFRSGKEMIRMAEVYHEENDLEKAFILYSKFVTLFVEKLPKHPGYKTASSVDRSNNKKLLALVFPIAETIKTKLKGKYAAEEEARLAKEKAEQARRAREEQLQQEEMRERAKEEERLKQDEIRRKEELEQRMLAESEEQLKRLKMIQEGEKNRNKENSPAHRPGALVSTMIVSSTIPSAPSPTAVLPPPPSYQSVVSNYGPTVPDRNLKPSSPTSVGDVSSFGQPPPFVDRALKPSHFTSVGDQGFKAVYVPNELITKFLNLAYSNTTRNVETCGILCGKLAHSTWRITHLLVPHQHGKADSCDITNEEDLAEYQDENQLITLGWIHTHPTQTAFLSSVDQHTHWPYQKLLPEAIAIVCSPKFHETGFFYLTPDYGMDFIRNCSGKGFHEHPKLQPIFETCPYVQIDHSAAVTVVDLRH